MDTQQQLIEVIISWQTDFNIFILWAILIPLCGYFFMFFAKKKVKFSERNLAVESFNSTDELISSYKKKSNFGRSKIGSALSILPMVLSMLYALNQCSVAALRVCEEKEVMHLLFVFGIAVLFFLLWHIFSLVHLNLNELRQKFPLKK